MARFLVIFLCVIVAVDCLTLFKKQEESAHISIPQEDICMIKFQQCIAPATTFDAKLVESDIDEACRQYDSVATCLRRVSRECEDTAVKFYTDQILPIGDYACSSEAKNLMKEFKRSSRCYNREDYQKEAVENIQRCVLHKTDPFAESDECREARVIYDCATEEIKKSCGDAAEQLVSGVFRIAFRSGFYFEDECSIEDREVKRGLNELVKKAFLLRRASV